MQNTGRLLLILKMVAVVVFAVGCFLIWRWELTYNRPKKTCEAAGYTWYAATKTCDAAPDVVCERKGFWWEPKTRQCLKPVSIQSLTMRPNKPG